MVFNNVARSSITTFHILHIIVSYFVVLSWLLDVGVSHLHWIFKGVYDVLFSLCFITHRHFLKRIKGWPHYLSMFIFILTLTQCLYNSSERGGRKKKVKEEGALLEERKRKAPDLPESPPMGSGKDCGPMRGCKSAESQTCGSAHELEQASATCYL